MNGAQLPMAHNDSSGLLTGPPADFLHGFLCPIVHRRGVILCKGTGEGFQFPRSQKRGLGHLASGETKRQNHEEWIGNVMNLMRKEILQRNPQEPLEQDSVTWAAFGGRYALLFDDADIAPIVFAGPGAEDAALRTYRNKSATLNCHLFAEIALSHPNFLAPKSVCNDAVVITVHQYKQIRVEILNDKQCVDELQAFDRMTEARSWLSAKGFREDQITIRVEQVCERASHSSGYSGIFHCANCQHSCVE